MKISKLPSFQTRVCTIENQLAITFVYLCYVLSLKNLEIVVFKLRVEK